MKKKILTFVMAAAMLLAMPMASFAAEQPADSAASGDKVVAAENTRSVSNSTVSTDRLSNTSGKITAYAVFTGTATRASCVIYLQEKYNGSWRAATGLGTTSYTKTAYNCNSISAGKTFTLKSGKVYRAKVVFTDVINGTTHIKTHYSGSF